MKIDKNKLALIIDQVSEDHCNVNTIEFRDDLVEKIHKFLTPPAFKVEYTEELGKLIAKADIELIIGEPGQNITINSLGDLTIVAKSTEVKFG